MAQPQNDQGSFDQDFLDYVLEELIEQPDNSFYYLSSFVAATAASMQFSAVLSMGGSALACSRQSITCSDSHCNSNDMTSFTNMSSIESPGLVDGRTIMECSMTLGG